MEEERRRKKGPASPPEQETCTPLRPSFKTPPTLKWYSQGHGGSNKVLLMSNNLYIRAGGVEPARCFRTPVAKPKPSAAPVRKEERPIEEAEAPEREQRAREEEKEKRKEGGK